MLPTFRLLKPQTLAEALRWLGSERNALPIAGGTNLMVDMRSGKLTPKTVVDIGALDELCGIEVTETEIVIGACARIADLLQSSALSECAPVLHSACRTFANTLIRNRATIGGNLVNNAPCADTAPALLVLGAEVELANSSEERRVPLEDFLLEPFTTTRQADEILTAVRFPVPPSSAVGRFQKMGLRKVSCMAKVDVACLLDFDEGGVCTDARIALGAASPVARRTKAAEDCIRGQRLSVDLIGEAAALTAQAAVPRAGSEYKQNVVAGLARRLLQEIAEEVGGTDG